MEQANGVATISRSYDRAGRTVYLTDSAGDYTYTLEYDLFGNLRRQAETYSANLTDRTVTNEYDGADRLLEEETVTGAVTTTSTYVYDKANNRTSLTVDDGTDVTVTTYSYTGNDANQLVEYTVELNSNLQKKVIFDYDDNGNRTKRTVEDDNEDVILDHWYNYDKENRLTSLHEWDGPGGGSPDLTYSYEYDYRTRRVRRHNGGTPVDLSFSGGLSVQEYTTGNDPDAEYVRGSDYGGGVGGILYSIRGGDASYNHYNGRGDVVAQTDDTGSLTYQAAYEAFGSHDGADPRTQESGSSADPHRANTKEEDPTGLLNEGFRYRDLEAGVFITRDPLGFVDGPNVYAYVVQNPWSKFDPTGLSWKHKGKAVYGVFNLGKKYQRQLQRTYTRLTAEIRKNGGKWKGSKQPTPVLKNGGNIEPGKTYKISDLDAASLDGKYTGKSITYNADGFPVYDDFIRTVDGKVGRVEIEFSARKGKKGRNDDFKVADEALGIDAAYRKEHKLTWHHNEDMTTMELVPTDIHGGTSHLGGRALFEEGIDRGWISTSKAGLAFRTLMPKTAEAKGFWATTGALALDAWAWADPGFGDVYSLSDHLYGPNGIGHEKGAWRIRGSPGPAPKKDEKEK